MDLDSCLNVNLKRNAPEVPQTPAPKRPKVDPQSQRAIRPVGGGFKGFTPAFSPSDLKHTPANLKSLRLVPPPLPPLSTTPLSKKVVKRETPVTARVPALPPEFSSAPKHPLRALVAPPLNSAGPLSDAGTSSPPRLRTISTTRLALATTPSPFPKDEESEKLALALLSQAKETAIGGEHADLTIGLGFSPEKTGKGGKRSFIRSGLADRANHLISRAQTAFSLWKSEINAHLAAGRRLAPDLTLRVCDVLSSVESPHSSAPSSESHTRTAIAQCRVVSRRDAARSSEQSDAISETIDEDTLLVLFSADKSTAGSTMISALDGFKDGVKVMVWRPWNEILLDPGQSEQFSRKAMLCPRFVVL